MNQISSSTSTTTTSMSVCRNLRVIRKEEVVGCSCNGGDCIDSDLYHQFIIDTFCLMGSVCC